MLPNRKIRSQIALKGMSALMGNHIDISRRPVKVCKNKRHLVVRKHIHIAAGTLIFPAKDIKELHFPHFSHESRGLGGKLIVHLLSGCHDFFRASARRRVSLREENIFIIIVEMLESQSLSSLFMQFFHKGNKVTLHLIPKAFNFLLAVTVTIHSGIADFGKIRIAKQASLLSSVLYQLIIEGIQFLPMLLKKSTVLFPGSFSYRAVHAGKIRAHKRKV